MDPNVPPPSIAPQESAVVVQDIALASQVPVDPSTAKRKSDEHHGNFKKSKPTRSALNISVSSIRPMVSLVVCKPSFRAIPDLLRLVNSYLESNLPRGITVEESLTDLKRAFFYNTKTFIARQEAKATGHTPPVTREYVQLPLIAALFIGAFGSATIQAGNTPVRLYVTLSRTEKILRRLLNITDNTAVEEAKFNSRWDRIIKAIVVDGCGQVTDGKSLLFTGVVTINDLVYTVTPTQITGQDEIIAGVLALREFAVKGDSFVPVVTREESSLLALLSTVMRSTHDITHSRFVDDVLIKLKA